MAYDGYVTIDFSSEFSQYEIIQGFFDRVYGSDKSYGKWGEIDILSNRFEIPKGTYYIKAAGLSSTGVYTFNLHTEPLPKEFVKPVILGATNKSIIINSTFNPMSQVQTNDNKDGDLTDAMKVTGSVNSHKKGVYTLTYTAQDSSGNVATVTRKIPVIDNVKPVILGATNKTIKLKTTFNSKTGVTAKDNSDGILTSKVKVTGTVNTKKKGVYSLRYTVIDTSGNPAIVVRKITVK